MACPTALCSRTGGRLFAPSESEELVRALGDITKKEVRRGLVEKALWDTPFLLALIVALLCAEWILRRRAGLA